MTDVEFSIQHYTNFLTAGERSLFKGSRNSGGRPQPSREVGWRRSGKNEMEHPQGGKEKNNRCADCVVPVQQAPNSAWTSGWRPGGLAGDRWFGHVITSSARHRPLWLDVAANASALQRGRGRARCGLPYPLPPKSRAVPRPADGKNAQEFRMLERASATVAADVDWRNSRRHRSLASRDDLRCPFRSWGARSRENATAVWGRVRSSCEQ